MEVNQMIAIDEIVENNEPILFAEYLYMNYPDFAEEAMEKIKALITVKEIINNLDKGGKNV